MDDEGYFGKKSLTPDFLNRNKKEDDGNDEYADPTAKAKNAAKKATKDATMKIAAKAVGAATGTGPAAEAALKGAEEAAAKKGLNDIAKLEKMPDLFTGSGKDDGKKKKKMSLAKALPLALIVLLLGFGALIAFAVTNLLGPHISANTSNLTNFSRTAVVETEKTLLVWLSKGNALPAKLQQRLLDHGADSADGSTIVFNGQSYSGDAIASAMDNDTDFAELINSATYSNALDYHDNSANDTYDHLAQNRNVFKDFDGGTDEAAYDTLRTNAAGGSNTADVSLVTGGEEETASTTTCPDGYTMGESGNCVAEGKTDTSPTTTCPAGYTLEGGICKKESDARADKATADAENYLRSIVSKTVSGTNSYSLLSAGANTACSIWKVANIVSLAINASDTYSSVNYFMDTMESISKTMYGQGDSAGIHQTYNYFSTPTTETVTNPDGTTSTVSGSPLMSEWAKTTLGGVKGSTTAAKPYSFARISSYVLSDSNLLFNLLSYVGVLTSKTVGDACSIVGFTTSLFSLVGIVTGGIIQIAVGAILGTVTSEVTYDALKFLVPTIAKSLFSNAYTEYENGVPGGEEFGRGATAANSRIGRQASGLMPASEENSLAYQKLQAVTIARDNAIDRTRRSPFDVTSPNTFLGSILNKFAFVPTLNGNSMLANLASGNVLTTFTSLANTAKTSFNSVAYAADDDININYYYTTYGDCSEQNGIDISGDMYCNAFEASDSSMFSLTPDDLAASPIIQSAITVDEDGNEHIIDDKNNGLYQFVFFAAERDSPWGSYDVNIINEFCEINLGLLNNVPIFNQVKNMGENACALANSDLATGERFVYSSSNSNWNSTIKYYQAYVSQARILDRLGYYEERGINSPVAVLRADYRAEHPLDNSRAGILARTSGMSKTDATALLNVYDYYQVVANYDPSERYSFIEQKNPEDVLPEFTDPAEPTVIAFVPNAQKLYVITRREEITL